MKFRFKGFAKGCIVVFLTIITLIMVLYATFNIVDIKNPLLNPPESTNKIHLSLFYPPAVGSKFTLGTVNLTIDVEIVLTYNGTMVERQPILMEASGTLPSQFVQKISAVSVSFEGASPYSGITFTPGFGVVLFPTETAPSGLPIVLGGGLVGDSALIKWVVQGDYYPTMIISYKNFSTPDTVIGYQDFRLHISPSEVVQQERYSRINNVLTIALFSFATIESLVLISKFLPKKWLVDTERYGNEQTAQEKQSTPKKDEPNKKPQWTYKYKI